MTNTEHELDVCSDCILIIANDDDSGIADPEAHRAAMAERWSGFHLIPGGGDDEGRWSTRECDGCGDVDGDRHRAYAVPR